MTRVPFVKMEGAGNDYVFVDAVRTGFPVERGAELARCWSDRHRGIGADGLIVVLRGDRAPVRMVMWNADGSRGAHFEHTIAVTETGPVVLSARSA